MEADSRILSEVLSTRMKSKSSSGEKSSEGIGSSFNGVKINSGPDTARKDLVDGANGDRGRIAESERFSARSWPRSGVLGAPTA